MLWGGPTTWLGTGATPTAAGRQLDRKRDFLLAHACCRLVSWARRPVGAGHEGFSKSPHPPRGRATPCRGAGAACLGNWRVAASSAPAPQETQALVIVLGTLPLSALPSVGTLSLPSQRHHHQHQDPSPPPTAPQAPVTKVSPPASAAHVPAHCGDRRHHQPHPQGTAVLLAAGDGRPRRQSRVPRRMAWGQRCGDDEKNKVQGKEWLVVERTVEGGPRLPLGDLPHRWQRPERLGPGSWAHYPPCRGASLRHVNLHFLLWRGCQDPVCPTLRQLDGHRGPPRDKLWAHGGRWPGAVPTRGSQSPSPAATGPEGKFRPGGVGVAQGLGLLPPSPAHLWPCPHGPLQAGLASAMGHPSEGRGAPAGDPHCAGGLNSLGLQQAVAER